MFLRVFRCVSTEHVGLWRWCNDCNGGDDNDEDKNNNIVLPNPVNVGAIFLSAENDQGNGK